MMKKIIKNRFYLSSALVILLASFLRFYNYFDRFGIAYDQAHDAIVARYAVETFSLPLVAPFSSGAQFQDSGVWYWFLMIPTAIANSIFIAPWVATTVYCIGFVGFVIYVGKKIVDEKFGLMAGLFAALSTSQIGQSVNLSLTALISMTSLAAIYFASRYFKEPKNTHIFWVGLFVSLCATIHLQGVLLLLFIPIFVIVGRIRNLRSYLYLLAGLFVPLIPLIVFDFKNDFVNSSGLINYMFRKNEVTYEVLGRRWLTFLFSFWPSSWANIIGGSIAVSYITFIFIARTFLVNFKKIEKIWVLIGLTFLVDVICMRYVKSPLYDSYLNFLHPFIYLLSAYAVYQTLRWKKLLGILVFLIIIIGSLYRDIGEITYAGNNATLDVVSKMESLVESKYPNEKFDFYDYGYKQVGHSLPLVLAMDVKEKIDREGRRIGIILDIDASKSSYFKKLGTVNGYTVVDLGSSNSAMLEKVNWASINPSSIYNSTQNWYKKK